MLTVLVLANPIGAAAAPCGERGADSHLSITEQDGLLTLEARDVRLVEVLEQLGELTGFTTRHFGNPDDCVPVTASYDRRAPADLVEQLLAATNRIIFYAPSATAGSRRSVSQVWLLGAATGGDVAADSDVLDSSDVDLDHDDPARRSEAVLKLSQQVSIGTAQDEDSEVLLSRVGQALQQDPDPLVRSRAAIALGALQHEAAIGDLEAALLDENFTVRTQAITALGQIGGDRAGTALGSVLLDQNIDPVERVMAAQALWRHGSETARSYLQLGAGDENEQVRAAASEPPASGAAEQAPEQSGPQNTE